MVKRGLAHRRPKVRTLPGSASRKNERKRADGKSRFALPSGAQRSRDVDPLRRDRVGKQAGQKRGTGKRRAASKRARIARRVGR